MGDYSFSDDEGFYDESDDEDYDRALDQVQAQLDEEEQKTYAADDGASVGASEKRALTDLESEESKAEQSGERGQEQVADLPGHGHRDEKRDLKADEDSEEEQSNTEQSVPEDSV